MAKYKKNVNFWGKKLKEKRKKMGWTQKKMAEAIGTVSKRTYEAYERGEVVPSLPDQRVIEGRFNWHMEVLFQDIQPIVAPLINKIPFIDYDDSWYEIKDKEIEVLTEDFEKILLNLSRVIIGMEKMSSMTETSQYNFDHDKYEKLKLEKKSLQKNFKINLESLNSQDVFYKILKGSNDNQFKILLQSRSKHEEENQLSSKGTILQILNPFKKNKVNHEIEKLKSKINELNQKNQLRQELEDEREKLINRITAKLNEKFKDNISNDSEEVVRNILEQQGFKIDKNVFFHKKIEKEGIVLRPDVQIKLSNGYSLVVETKLPMRYYHDYFDAYANKKLPELEKIKNNIEKSIKNYIKRVSHQAYHQIPGVFNYVILFLPSDQHVKIAKESVRSKISLHQYAYENNIIISGPSSIYGDISWAEKLIKKSSKLEKLDEVSKFSHQIYEKLKTIQDNYERSLREQEKVLEKLSKTSLTEKFKIKKFENPADEYLAYKEYISSDVSEEEL